jgi:23S rRNA (adenine2503-C2)-methyltransferase
MKPSIYSFSLPELREFLKTQGFSKFVGDQVYNWIYKKFSFSPQDWKNLSKKLTQFIEEKMGLILPKIIWEGISTDGTRKYLLQLEDKQTIECVVIPAKNRITLCVSTQVGCAIGCSFCHTGTMGLKRNLKIEEIVGQYLVINKHLKEKINAETRITNIVYMGQGEPLHNFEFVKNATIILMEEKGLGLGQRKITLSTSGLVPQIEKLSEFPPVNVAISLHASHDNIRTELMPINKVYDLKRLFNAIKKIPLKAHRHITYEYILIKELNDRQEDIDGLVALLPKKVSKVNLIPFNEYPGSEFKRPSNDRILWFQNQLLDNGIITTIRATKGQDILAACGQLKSEMENLNLWT